MVRSHKAERKASDLQACQTTSPCQNLKKESMTNKEYISTNQALDILKDSWLADHYTCNLPSLIDWITKYNLGFKFAGRWKVDKEKLIKFIGNPK